jgi:hypothetical protein
MKHDTYDKYPADSLDLPERALLTVWDCLAAYRDDLVLVGGLAIKHLTRAPRVGQPGPVTQDVDFGISLAAESGMYGSLRETLAAHGFQWVKSRFLRTFPGFDLYVDLLTDDDKADTGTALVDDGLAVGIVPGINRALAHTRLVEVHGKSLTGAALHAQVKVAEVGPMMVLKLNAFGGPMGRKAGKDVHDLLYLTMNCEGEAEHAIAAFHAEKAAGNRGVPHALHAAKTSFSHLNAPGPMACAAFRLNNRHELPALAAESLRIRQQCVTLAEALLG